MADRHMTLTPLRDDTRTRLDVRSPRDSLSRSAAGAPSGPCGVRAPSTRPAQEAVAGPSGPPRGPGETHPVAPPRPRPPARDGDLRGSGLKAALRVAAQATVWLEEVDAGRRPAGHLRLFLEPGLAARWSVRPPTLRPPATVRSLGPVQVRRRGRRPQCNVVLLVDDADAVRPVSLELVPRGTDWFVSDIVRPGLDDPPSLPHGWALALADPDCQGPGAR